MRRGQGKEAASAAPYTLAIIGDVIYDKIFVHKLVLLPFFV